MWKESTLDVSDLLEQEGRTPGLHVTDVLKSIVKDREMVFGPVKESSPTYALIGRIFEEGYVNGLMRKYPGRYERMSQGEKDGLFYTPDLRDKEASKIIDVKARWISYRELGIMEEEYWSVRAQLMSYCWAERTTRGAIHVIHLNRHPPEIIEWHCDFDPSTLFNNWTMILEQAALIRAQGGKDGLE